MKRILLLALTLLAFAGIPRTLRAADAPKPLRALMVCGGCCHDYKNQKQILSEGISARANVEWTIVQEDAPTGSDERNHRVSIYEKPDWWKGYDVIVHNECFGAIADNAFIEGITAAQKAECTTYGTNEPPYGILSDPHHGTCWRIWHSTNVANGLGSE